MLGVRHISFSNARMVVVSRMLGVILLLVIRSSQLFLEYSDPVVARAVVVVLVANISSILTLH